MLQLEIIGNLGSDATVKDINGKSYISFNVAHSNGKDAPSTWVQVLAGEFLAKKILQYLKKGSSVFVRGNLQVSTYEAKNGGGTKVSLSVFANELQLIRTVEANVVAGAKEIKEHEAAYQPAPHAPVSSPLVPNGAMNPEDDDLPF